jgi:predicted  nucleic acid-binding Zn-ribbon protein
MSVKTNQPRSASAMTELDALADGETGSDLGGETHHLKSTIAALRQALEDGEAERNSVRQKVRAAYEGEFAELKATITALRDELEESRHEGRAEAERALAGIGKCRLA